VICISTRGVAPAVSFREALFSGLAPDGGLYVPEVLPVLDPAVWTAARGAAMAEIGTAMLGPLIGDEISVGELKALLTEAFSWRSIFVVQIPVVLLALPATLSMRARVGRRRAEPDTSPDRPHVLANLALGMDDPEVGPKIRDFLNRA